MWNRHLHLLGKNGYHMMLHDEWRHHHSHRRVIAWFCVKPKGLVWYDRVQCSTDAASNCHSPSCVCVAISSMFSLKSWKNKLNRDGCIKFPPPPPSQSPSTIIMRHVDKCVLYFSTLLNCMKNIFKLDHCSSSLSNYITLCEYIFACCCLYQQAQISSQGLGIV